MLKLKCIFILILFHTPLFIMYGQKVDVTGLIIDQKGEAIIGVTVIEEGTSNGVVTDFNGHFALSVKDGAKLNISSVGYKTQMIIAKKGKEIIVTLEENTEQLEELVVVGYGTMRKRDLTGAISSLNSKELTENKPINLATALQGKISGLEIVTASEPGSTSNYRIRGASTLSEEGSTPLFIVDGMEIEDIDNINPQDIASIEVLKDAASASIYGSKSANGVIIITTKNGLNLKPAVSLSYSLRTSQIGRKLPQMNRRQSIDFDILRTYLESGIVTGASTYVTDSLNPSFADDNYYQEILFRNAITHQIDLSLSGTTDKMKYFISNGYADENGIQLNTFNRRGTIRINIDYDPTKKFTIGNRLSLAYSNGRSTPSGGRSRLLERPANMSVIMPDGSYTPVIASRANPLAWTEISINNTKSYNLNFYEFIDWKILSDLSFRSSIAGTVYQKNYRYFAPAVLSAQQITSSDNRNSTGVRWTHEDVLTYSHTFNNNHFLSAMAGFSMQGDNNEYLQLSVSDNISEAIPTSASFNTVNMNNTQHFVTENRMVSFFNRVSYNYKSKYLFNANIRADASSRFGAKKRWGVFPSLSAGWRFSEENFFNWAKPSLSDAKIRYSYGTTGNQTASDYAALSQYSTIAYADYIGIYPTQLENNTLGWEETRQHNLGLDLAFFQSRLSLVLDLYSKDTKAVLFNMKLPGTSGFSSSYTNVGSISNKGIEFTISGHAVKTKDFDLNLLFNFAFNNNTLNHIPKENASITNNIYIIDNGYSLGAMYGYKALQIFQYDQSNAFTDDWQQLTPIFDDKDSFTGYMLNGKPYEGQIQQLRYGTAKGEIFKGGDVMWHDVNQDGVINADDRQIIGNGQPKFIGGFNVDIRWKRVSLSSFFNYSLGGNVINVYEANRNAHIYGTLTQASPVYLAQSWQAPGDITKYPIPSIRRAIVENTRINSSLWIQDGAYIRLKNLKLAYSLPQKWSEKMKMQDFTLSIMMQDFFTWTNYDGFDPEVKSYGFALGYDSNSYPKQKSVLLGLNIFF